ncbi:MAG TPA: ParA family protein [Chthoniobacterales bacterium]
MKTIALVNGKGGCGKTTLSLLLGMALLRSGRRVQFIDLDPQKSLTGILKFHQIAETVDEPEFVMIDTPPRLDSGEIAKAIRAADVICIPTRPLVFDLGVTVNTSALVAKTKTPGSKALIVFNQVRKGTLATKDAQNLDRSKFSVPVAKASISMRECIYRATSTKDGWKALDEPAAAELLSLALSLG